MTTLSQPSRDPSQNLILRTLLVPAALVLTMLALFAPALAKAAPPAPSQKVFVDAEGEGSVKRVEVRSRTADEGMTLTFKVKVADADVEDLRAEWKSPDGWSVTTLERTARGQFEGSIALATPSDIDFILLGTDAEGDLYGVRYATLLDPAHVDITNH